MDVVSIKSLPEQEVELSATCYDRHHSLGAAGKVSLYLLTFLMSKQTAILLY